MIELMNWDAGTSRWRKEIQGRAYAISCRALGLPRTKEASVQAANKWWLAKLAEIADSEAPKQLDQKAADQKAADQKAADKWFLAELRKLDTRPTTTAQGDEMLKALERLTQLRRQTLAFQEEQKALLEVVEKLS